MEKLIMVICFCERPDIGKTKTKHLPSLLCTLKPVGESVLAVPCAGVSASSSSFSHSCSSITFLVPVDALTLTSKVQGDQNTQQLSLALRGRLSHMLLN